LPDPEFVWITPDALSQNIAPLSSFPGINDRNKKNSKQKNWSPESKAERDFLFDPQDNSAAL
jgi:hypothetical protein